MNGAGEKGSAVRADRYEAEPAPLPDRRDTQESIRSGCMSMRRIKIRGGYGEHGRSCFLAEYGTKGCFFMVDCGIMDTDLCPYPRITREELSQVDFLFLTHCHKDHSGAFRYLAERGFSGWLVTSALTFTLSAIVYDKVIFLDTSDFPGTSARGLERRLSPELTLRYGRSGHCPGSLWFLLTDSLRSCFFSGDYQAGSLLYQCDEVCGVQADLAVVDCAHDETRKRAAALRQELFFLFREWFPNARILADREFVRCSKRMAAEPCWFRRKAVAESLETQFPGAESGVTLAGKNAADCGAAVFLTGRVRSGGIPEALLALGKAEKYLFPHHQSMGDLEEIADNNRFAAVLPFHNGKQELLIG